MARSPRDFIARFLSDTSKFDTSDAVDDLDKLATESDSAGRAVDDFGDKTDRVARDVDDAFDRIAASAKAGSRKVEDAVDETDLDGGLKAKAGETGSEVGAEFSENIGEAMRSGDYAGTLVETFTSLSGALGPLGIGIGLGAAVAVNIIKGLDDKSIEFQEAVASFLNAIDEETKRVDFAATFTEQLEKMGAALTDVEDPAARQVAALDRLRQIAADTGVPLGTLADLLSGRLAPDLTDADEKMGKFIDSQTRYTSTVSGQTVTAISDSAQAVKDLLTQVDPLAPALDKATESGRILDNILGGLETSADDAALAFDALKRSANEALEAGTASRQQVAAELADAKANPGTAKRAVS